jgi:hypothetical protein
LFFSSSACFHFLRLILDSALVDLVFSRVHVVDKEGRINPFFIAISGGKEFICAIQIGRRRWVCASNNEQQLSYHHH